MCGKAKKKTGRRFREKSTNRRERGCGSTSETGVKTAPARHQRCTKNHPASLAVNPFWYHSLRRKRYKPRGLSPCEEDRTGPIQRFPQAGALFFLFWKKGECRATFPSTISRGRWNRQEGGKDMVSIPLPQNNLHAAVSVRAEELRGVGRRRRTARPPSRSLDSPRKTRMGEPKGQAGTKPAGHIPKVEFDLRNSPRSSRGNCPAPASSPAAKKKKTFVSEREGQVQSIRQRWAGVAPNTSADRQSEGPERRADRGPGQLQTR